MSGALTGALNARHGGAVALRTGAQMAGVGAAIGGGLGALQRTSKTKLVRRD